jgi:hypothetical protein
MLAVVMTLLVCGLALGACSPAEPAVVRELVALAPAGSNVTVTHVSEDPLGLGTWRAHWEWSFEAADPPSAIAAYRAWFVEQEIPMWVPGPDDEWPNPETAVSPADGIGPAIYVQPGRGSKEVVENGETITIDTEVPGTTVFGTLSDESIGPDGQLRR